MAFLRRCKEWRANPVRLGSTASIEIATCREDVDQSLALNLAQFGGCRGKVAVRFVTMIFFMAWDIEIGGWQA